jgi:transposase
MIRSKAFRRLIEVAKLNPKSPKEIAEEFNMSLATAYDYWNTIRELKEIFTKKIDEKHEMLKREIENLKLDIAEIKSKDLEDKLIKLKIGLDELLEERKRRLGY